MDSWELGVPSDPQVLSAEGGAPPETIDRARLAPLTGRDTEVSLLKDRWEQAQEGMGQVVLLIGEPGLGKSRLVSTIKQHVQPSDQDSADSKDAPSASIVEWRCSQRFQNTGLYPVCDFFERMLCFARDDSPAVRFERLARHLSELDLARPEILALFASMLFLPADGLPALGLSASREREETFRALRLWLSAYAARRPVLFIIEDLHWIDASTLEFLGQFLTEGLHNRILTVLAFRPEFKAPWPPGVHQTSLALSRLTRRQVGDLMRRRTGNPVPEALVEQIYTRTRGVPLLVEEFATLAQETMALGPAGLAREMPATLQDLVLARIDRMATDREVAQLAATIGREFSHDMLAAVANKDEASLQADIAKLVSAEILYTRGRPPRYIFKHALLEDALHSSLDAETRRGFHRRIAQALETKFPHTVEVQPELLAHHCTEGGLTEKAIGYWLKAGLRSHRRFANAEAIGHFTKGVALLSKLPESRERDAQELQFLVPLGTTYITAHGYASPQVGPAFQRARDLCERSGQPQQLFAIMWGTWVWHLVRADLRLGMTLAGEAVALAESTNDPGMLMEALFLPAVTAAFRGDFDAARVHCSRALQHDNRERTRAWAAVTGEDSGVAHRCYLSVALWHLGSPDEALKLNQEAVDLARSLAQPFTLAFALEHRAWLCTQCRLAVEAQAAADEEISISTQQGFAYWLASATLFRADAMVLQGRSAEALPLLLKGIEDLRATGAALDLTLHLGFLGAACTSAGRYDEGLKALDEGLALAEKFDERFYEAELHRLRGELLLTKPDSEGPAEESFRKAIDIARRQQSKAWELRSTISLARLWERQHRRDEARALLQAVCVSYSQGFTTPDLIDANTLLETLGDARMREEIASAVKYVRGCIPAPMAAPVRVDWRYVPSSNIGGDTIGYHWIDDDHLAFYLVDVTGHGLDSALLSVAIVNVLRSGSVPGSDMRQPDQVLATLNEAFQGDAHGDKFFTIWYGVHRRSTAQLSWSSGGHHPAVLVTPDDPKPTLLPSTGMMMGVCRGMEFRAESCPVAPGSRLLIFSDGVFEILRDGRYAWNLGACIDYLAAQSKHDNSVMDELLAHVQRLHGSPLLDDDFSIIEAHFSAHAPCGRHQNP